MLILRLSSIWIDHRQVRCKHLKEWQVHLKTKRIDSQALKLEWLHKLVLKVIRIKILWVNQHPNRLWASTKTMKPIWDKKGFKGMGVLVNYIFKILLFKLLITLQWSLRSAIFPIFSLLKLRYLKQNQRNCRRYISTKLWKIGMWESTQTLITNMLRTNN